MLPILLAGLAAPHAAAQSFAASATGILDASTPMAMPQSYGPGPIPSTPVIVTVNGPMGAATATAALYSWMMNVSLHVVANGYASASIDLRLQAPAWAGAELRFISQRSGYVGYGASVAGRSYNPDPSGSLLVEALVPPGGLSVLISCSAQTPFPPTQSSLNLNVFWSYPGVAPAGGPTPGCLGPAVAWTRGIPHVGNSGFGFTCANAHPYLGAVSAVGFGGLTVPFVYDGVNVWLDPWRPIATLYLQSTAGGEVFHPLGVPADPILAGMVVFAQFLVFEPPGCMPLGLSGSNAIRVTLQP